MSSTIEIYPTKDIKIINSIITDPDVWEGSKDDSCPMTPDGFDASSILDKFLFICVSVDSVDSGLFMLIMDSAETYFVHTMMMARCRGSKAIKAGRKTIEWLFNHTACTRIESYCFSDSPATLLFAKLCGFQVSSRSPHPKTREGENVDIISCFINKPTNL